LGTIGTFQEYSKNLNVFLDKKKIYSYFSNLFFNRFKIKIDSLFITSKDVILAKYLEDIEQGKYYKFFNSVQSEIWVEGDLCANNLSKLWQKYSRSINKGNLSLTEIKSISDLFDMSDIKKEQIRILVTNKTGSESEGRRFSSLLTAYGLNVVKLDYKGEVERKTYINLNKPEYINSRSISVLEYLVSNQVSNMQINTKTNVFSDLEIVIGEDIVTL
jgi:hypothetical protein